MLPNITFTNVALDAQLVPEPSAWMLAGLGCLAFLPFCRRRAARRAE
jgi:hypothetical protein